MKKGKIGQSLKEIRQLNEKILRLIDEGKYELLQKTLQQSKTLTSKALNSFRKDDKTLIFYTCIKHSTQPKFIELLLKYGADPKMPAVNTHKEELSHLEAVVTMALSEEISEDTAYSLYDMLLSYGAPIYSTHNSEYGNVLLLSAGLKNKKIFFSILQHHDVGLIIKQPQNSVDPLCRLVQQHDLDLGLLLVVLKWLERINFLGTEKIKKYEPYSQNNSDFLHTLLPKLFDITESNLLEASVKFFERIVAELVKHDKESLDRVDKDGKSLLYHVFFHSSANSTPRANFRETELLEILLKNGLKNYNITIDKLMIPAIFLFITTHNGQAIKHLLNYGSSKIDLSFALNFSLRERLIEVPLFVLEKKYKVDSLLLAKIAGLFIEKKEFDNAKAAIENIPPYTEAINYQDSDGDTLLHYAIFTESLELVKILLNKGANPEIKNNNNNSPVSILKSIEDECLSDSIVEIKKFILSRIPKSLDKEKVEKTTELDDEQQEVWSKYDKFFKLLKGGEQVKHLHTWQIEKSVIIRQNDKEVYKSKNAHHEDIFVLLNTDFPQEYAKLFEPAIISGFSAKNPKLIHSSGLKFFNKKQVFEVKINADARLVGYKIYENREGKQLYILEKYCNNHHAVELYAKNKIVLYHKAALTDKIGQKDSVNFSDFDIEKQKPYKSDSNLLGQNENEIEY